ncbi:hypothetical protein IGK15_002990 [Enterococcus sp. AZ045]|uniref:ATP-binding protein n=1 Tax=Enterococcus sp. AZ045 TaxID=2774807 RepID=UPI003F2631AA
MKLAIPLKHVYENMMYTKDNEIWAYYRIQSVSMPVTADKKKEEVKAKFRHLIGELKESGNVDIFMVPKDMTLEERFEELSDSFCKDLPEVARYYAKNTIKRLEHEMGLIYTYDWIIGVPLKSNELIDSFKDGMKKTYEKFRTNVVTQLGYDVVVGEKEFLAYREAELLIRRKMNLFQGKPLNEEEMNYLNRLNFIRNMPHTLEEEYANDTLENITDSEIDPSSRAGVLKLKSIEGESAIALLPISDTPLEVSYMHVAEIVQTLPFPVELRFKLNFTQTKGALGMEGKANRSSLRLKNVVRESRAVGNAEGREISDSRKVVGNLQEQLNAEKEIVDWLGGIVVYAKDEKECRKRVGMIISLFKARKIKISRAQFQQVYLFYKFMMGESLKTADKKWVQTTTVAGFCENLLAINQRVGYHTGWYLGRVDPHLTPASTLQSAIRGSRNIILSNPFVANKYNEAMKTASLHQVVTGETGQGKSFLVSLLFMYMAMLDVKGLFIDPKTEKNKQIKAFLAKKENQKKYPYLYRLVRSFHLVALDPDKEENWGVLDPIVFLKGTDAKDTAEAMIYQIINLDDSRLAQTEVSRNIRLTIEERAQGKRVGMMNVIEKLQGHEEKEVKQVGDLLAEKVAGSVLRLGFSNGNTEGLSFTNRITIVGVLGLSVPKETDDPRFYTTAEKSSLALMVPLGKFCERFGAMNEEEETFEVFEEAWLFNTSPVGRKVLNAMKRVGRSQNNMLIYSTQSVADVNQEDDHGNFGTIFAFNEPKEEDKILEHVGVTVSEKNKEWLSGMKKGQCLMLDPYGNVQKISVHALFPEMLQLFQTVKETSGSNAEQRFS